MAEAPVANDNEAFEAARARQIRRLVPWDGPFAGASQPHLRNKMRPVSE